MASLLPNDPSRRRATETPPSAASGDIASGADSASPPFGSGSGSTGSTAPVIPGYDIQRQIGRGGSATVYLAREQKHDRLVAVKVLHPMLAASIQSERFLREIEIIARLAHPNILPLLDSGRAGDLLYYVTPYVPGESLRGRLERERRLAVGDAVRIAREAAEALDYAHRQGVVHRDVKPENILLADGHALVADFGIARALSVATDDRLTSGLAPATPRYMSPEQAGGASEIDGRSDTYSLACVLYEMLAGAAPFQGTTPQELAAKHLAAPVPTLRGIAPPIPRTVERALACALAKLPAERFATAAEFAEALAVESGEWPRVTGSRTIASLRDSRAKRLAVGVVIVAGIALVVVKLGSRASARGELRGDTTLVAVLPMSARGAVDTRLDDDLLHDALARWRDVRLVDPFQVGDAIRQRGSPRSLREAATIAASLGAGRLILAQVAPRGDARHVSATLYDVSTSRSLYEKTADIPASLGAASVAYSELADSLLLRGAAVDSVPAGSSASRSLPAAQAFARAQSALDEWDLSVADSALQTAVAYDADFARASLWLAQVRAWREDLRSSWYTLAQRAVSLSEQLSPRERRLAEALAQLGGGNFAAACDVYDGLRRLNNRDFAAWFGLGQCRTLDNIVVPSTTSPSGWSYRSSRHRAMEAYAQAFAILPSIHRGYERGAFERVELLLLASAELKIGYGIADSARFLARPGLLADTLALIPYPWQLVHAGTAAVIPPRFTEALSRRRTEFRRIAAGWSAAFPRSAGAKQAVALALELMNDPEAIDTVRLARQLAQDTAKKKLLAVTEVMLLVKFGLPDDVEKLRTAQALAESLLVRDARSPSRAELLGPVAALLGHCHRAEELARRAAPPGGYFGIPSEMIANAGALLARAAIGCAGAPPTPSLASLLTAIERQFPSSSERQRAEEMLLSRPALLGDAVDPRVLRELTASTQNNLLRGMDALARNDTAGSRRFLEEFERTPEIFTPTPDMTLAKARLWNRLGDRAHAVRTLDASLGSARTYDTKNALEDVANAGALVSAMVLRADLAAQVSDRASARRWGAAVAILWTTADADVQPIRRRMEKYAASR